MQRLDKYTKEAAAAADSSINKYWKAGTGFLIIMHIVAFNQDITCPKVGDQSGTSDIIFLMPSPGVHEYLHGLRGARVSGGCFHSRVKAGTWMFAWI